MPNLQEIKAPKGYVGILTDTKGKVVATAYTFNQNNPDDIPLKAYQFKQAKIKLARAVVDTHCSPSFAQFIPEHCLLDIMNNMHGERDWLAGVIHSPTSRLNSSHLAHRNSLFRTKT